MRSSSNLLSWTRNSSGQTDSFQTNFDYWYIKDYFVSLFVSFDSESKVFWNLSGLELVKYIYPFRCWISSLSIGVIMII